MKVAISPLAALPFLLLVVTACQSPPPPVADGSPASAPPAPSSAPGPAAPRSPVFSETARNIANNCFTCHGPDGKSPGAIPGLSRLSAEQIAARLRSFKNGTASSTIMGRHAKAYSNAEIDAVAAYIAGVNKQAKP